MQATDDYARTWTQTGAPYTTPERRPDVLAAIAALEWTAIPDGDSLTLPFLPGEGIKAVIAELQLPKVSALAWNGVVDWPAAQPGGDREHYAVYGIEANYKNGRARVYVLDTGTQLLPVASDFWPEQRA